MSTTTLACYLIAAVCLGWTLAKRMTDAPEGVDPDYWRRRLRVWRRRRKS